MRGCVPVELVGKGQAAPAGSRPRPRTTTLSAKAGTKATLRSWSTPNPATCRSGPRTPHTPIGKPPTSRRTVGCFGRWSSPCRWSWTSGSAGAGPRVRPIADPRRAAALHAGDPPGRGDESALPPDDFEEGQRRIGPDAGDLVQTVQRQEPGAGRGSEIDRDPAQGMTGADPTAVDQDGEPGPGAGRQRRTDRRPIP